MKIIELFIQVLLYIIDFLGEIRIFIGFKAEAICGRKTMFEFDKNLK